MLPYIVFISRKLMQFLRIFHQSPPQFSRHSIRLLTLLIGYVDHRRTGWINYNTIGDRVR